MRMWWLSCMPVLLLAVPSLAQDVPQRVARLPTSQRVHPRLLRAAQRECCPFWFVGDRASYDRCCIRYGFCPICNGVSLLGGCWYGRAWHPVGAIIERNAAKCYEVHCQWARPQPTIRIVHIHQGCGCCLYRNRVYRPGHILNIGVCKRLQCRGGRWRSIAPLPGTNRPCPPGYFSFNNNFCLFIWPVWVPWGTAFKICNLLGGTLAIPLNFKENSVIVDHLNGTAGWLGASNGTWPNTATRGWADQTPWAKGEPKRELRSARSCLGLGLGSRHWSVRPCGWHGRPICVIRKVPCRQDFCIWNGGRFRNGATITTLSSCEKIVCANGYAVLKVTRTCCYYQGWNPWKGWISAYFPLGSFSPFPSTQCICRRDSTVTCCSGPRCLFSSQADEYRLSAQPAAVTTGGFDVANAAAQDAALS